MRTIELTAKSVEEATQLAAEKLSVEPTAISVTILEQVKGLFGKSQVRVRAEVAEATAPAEPKPKAAAKPKATKAKAEAKEEAPAEPTPAPKAKETRSSRGKKLDEPVVASSESDDKNGESEVVATKADGETLLKLLNGITDAGDLDVKAEVTQIQGRYVNIKLDGKDVAHLVGKHGEVLNALQYLINIIAGRKYERGIRATLDGNDFRKRREEKLTEHAQAVAAEVIRRHEEAVLDAMPAFDRRIVHKALGEYPGVTTYSEGEEPARRVVIAPAE